MSMIKELSHGPIRVHVEYDDHNNLTLTMEDEREITVWFSHCSALTRRIVPKVPAEVRPERGKPK